MTQVTKPVRVQCTEGLSPEKLRKVLKKNRPLLGGEFVVSNNVSDVEIEQLATAMLSAEIEAILADNPFLRALCAHCGLLPDLGGLTGGRPN